MIRHPYLDLVAGVVAMVWLNGGWPAVTGFAISVVVTLVVWRWRFPTRFGCAAHPEHIAGLLEDAVADMQDRARQFAGKQRDHAPTSEFPGARRLRV